MEEFSVGIEAINFYGGPAYIDVKELFEYLSLIHI